MRTKIVLLIIALILGGIAAVMAAQYLDRARTSIEAEGEPVEVLVAQEDIPRGLTAEELLANDMIALEEVPQRYVAAGAVSSAKSIEGMVLAVPLSSGEQVTSSRFQLPDTAGLAYSVPEGYVALSIPVDEVTGVSGMVKSGDHVALVVHFTDQVPAGFQAPIAKVLVKDAKVLAVGGLVTSAATTQEEEDQGGGGLGGANQQNARDQVDVRTFTLAVSVADAERIVFGVEEGAIYATLLPATGADLPATEGSMLSNILK